MSETKWTPGPWEVFFDDCKACGGEWIVTGPASGEHGQFCEEADARLISAAPDMAEALADFLENPQFQVGVGGNPIAVEKMLDRARSALAKARGET